MPKSLVEVRRPYTPQEQAAIMDAVYGALVAAFKIPAHDRTVRYIEHRPEHFLHAPQLAHPERDTVVTIDCFSGRSLDAKRRLYAEIVERLAPVGIPADHVTVILHEVTAENWGLGGRAGSDVDLGFKVDI
jgi:phenylpyruvate tautomerase PptA (4-oxalocrotonate tautomerase family)